MKSINILLAACFMTALFSLTLFAQDQKNMKMDHSKMVMKKDSVKAGDIVRKGIIDLKAIDKNKDGKVFQDMMDWNVISDKPGKCPLCGMTLKEVTLDAAKKNLIKNGFKAK